MVMILRIAGGGDVPTWEILATIGWLAVWVVLTMWAAAKVFRVGVLMYGKRPGLREVLRWVAQK